MTEDTSKEATESACIWISGLHRVERIGKKPSMSSTRGSSFKL